MVTFSVYNPAFQVASPKTTSANPTMNHTHASNTPNQLKSSDAVDIRFGKLFGRGDDTPAPTPVTGPPRRKVLGLLGGGLVAALVGDPIISTLTASPAAAAPAPVPANQEQAFNAAVQYLSEPVNSVDRVAGGVKVVTKSGYDYELQVPSKRLRHSRRQVTMIIPIGGEHQQVTVTSEGDTPTRATTYFLNTKGIKYTSDATAFRNAVYTAVTRIDKKLPKKDRLGSTAIKV